MGNETKAALNTDREIWRERPGDYYADALHVTEYGGIGINVGGRVIVMSAKSWHALALASMQPPPSLSAAVQTLEKVTLLMRVTLLASSEATSDTLNRAGVDATVSQWLELLEEALATLRQGEKPMEEFCDICEQPLGDAVAECPHCRTPFGTRIRWRQREDTQQLQGPRE